MEKEVKRVLESFMGIVDDCDRALNHVPPGAKDLREGLEHLRQSILIRFAEYGYEPFGNEGEIFDHSLHEAIAAEPSPGNEIVIARVHKRGWRFEGKIVRAATVTVLQGAPVERGRRRRGPKRRWAPHARGNAEEQR